MLKPETCPCDSCSNLQWPWPRLGSPSALKKHLSSVAIPEISSGIATLAFLLLPPVKGFFFPFGYRVYGRKVLRTKELTMCEDGKDKDSD